LKKKVVALKITENFSSNPKSLQSIANEISLLKFCKHPNVVEYISCYKMQNKDEIWLVMEYCSCSLQELLVMNNKMEEKDIAFISYQIINAITYLESKSVIHRDLKSANVLLSTLPPYIKLADFGLAILASGDRTETGICGSRYWMAPEMLRNEGYGCKVDIWAIGCIIMEMVDEHPPYYSYDSVKAMFYTAIKGVPCLNLHHLSQDINNVLAAIFQINPEKRISAAELLEHSWFNNQEVKDLNLAYSKKIQNFLYTVTFNRALDDLIGDRSF